MDDRTPGLESKHKPREGEPEPEMYMEEIGDALVELSSDLLSGEDLEQFPDIRTMSPRNQGVFAAHVCGYGPAFIAKMFGVSQPCISRLLNKIDPHRRYKLDANAKKAFLTNVLQTKASEAMACITPDKLIEASAKELTGVMKDCLGVSEQLNQSKHKALAPDRLSSMMEELDLLSQIPEAEIVEEK